MGVGLRGSLGGVGMILVTGASGLLGASVVSVALEHSREVVGVYHRHSIVRSGATLLAVDLTEESNTQRVFEDLRPRAVIHCAAETNVDWCQVHPKETNRINVEAAGRLAGIAFRMSARFLYVSTDSVFDGTRGNYAETDHPSPLNVYAQSKWQGEQEVLARNPDAIIARVNLYGWNVQHKQGLAEWILGRLLAEETVPGFTDAIFSPILSNDLAEILLAIVDRNVSGLYHVAGSEPVSKYEFARRIAVTFGLDAGKVTPARIAEVRLKAPRPRNTSLNVGKVCGALGRSMPDVNSGLRRFARLRPGACMGQAKSNLTGTQQ